MFLIRALTIGFNLASFHLWMPGSLKRSPLGFEWAGKGIQYCPNQQSSNGQQLHPGLSIYIRILCLWHFLLKQCEPKFLGMVFSFSLEKL
jgi:hypothetical protein